MDSPRVNLPTQGQADILNPMIFWTSFVCILKKKQLINPLKWKLVWIIFKNSFRTAKEARQLTFTKIIWLILFKRTMAGLSENHAKHMKTKFS
jgi:hypothetical protein